MTHLPVRITGRSLYQNYDVEEAGQGAGYEIVTVVSVRIFPIHVFPASWPSDHKYTAQETQVRSHWYAYLLGNKQ